MPTDNEVDAQIKKALDAARAAFAPGIARASSLLGGSEAARKDLAKIVAGTEAHVRRAIFFDKMNAEQRARAEKCLAALRAEFEGLADEKPV